MSVDEVIVEADGGSRGNPGPAGYGAVVFDAAHTAVLAERKESLGITTNNVAEYRGLIAGLEAAAALGARVAAVRMDSKLVVEQMSGRWKVKHAALIPLADRARRLVAGFDSVSFAWIPRAENAYADRLANEAMDDAKLVDEVRAARDAGHPLPGERGTGKAVRERGEPTGEGDTDGADPIADSRSATARLGTEASAPGWTGAVGRPTRLLLLRHGQTELSVHRRYSGRGNPPLTALGRDQAARAAKMLAAKGDIAAVVTSPLGRARETAEAAGAALGVPVRVVEGVIETDFGEWEGLTFAEAAERDPDLHKRWLGDPSLRAPGGESFDEVRERVEAARRDLVALYPGANIVVVSHVTPIKTLLQLALGVGPSLLYRLHLDLASLSIAEFYDDGGSSVRLVNDTSYL
ncbi:bifunctional RNase H/acid phosphatase [Nocardia donostiensis]|uniref:Bifunctional RNase H/acid phosphatase n=1 Tax=Nocardia donostiensis TaxID=1538463 RepID=A0A1W0B331_9NOCA|nr:bifunctional RNase H/acid phosphatase [Nocardia donostiensis]ONM48649.1 bifunctional RNase H/acid phosphatase [Nocardia donostiensis]OQS16838.1 bifunctional RNase H/acid phosphatase [Nocardia donostiensis]OQS23303.1 bifunctional RNase H/acid phosphatase [Nocardia donostiensis]